MKWFNLFSKMAVCICDPLLKTCTFSRGVTDRVEKYWEITIITNAVLVLAFCCHFVHNKDKYRVSPALSLEKSKQCKQTELQQTIALGWLCHTCIFWWWSWTLSYCSGPSGLREWRLPRKTLSKDTATLFLTSPNTLVHHNLQPTSFWCNLTVVTECKPG